MQDNMEILDQFNIDDLLNQFKEISINKNVSIKDAIVNAVKADTKYILMAYDQYHIHMSHSSSFEFNDRCLILDPRQFQMSREYMKSIDTPALFQTMLEIMSRISRSYDIISVMPMIDEYLEYFS